MEEAGFPENHPCEICFDPLGPLVDHPDLPSGREINFQIIRMYRIYHNLLTRWRIRDIGKILPPWIKSDAPQYLQATTICYHKKEAFPARLTSTTSRGRGFFHFGKKKLHIENSGNEKHLQIDDHEFEEARGTFRGIKREWNMKGWKNDCQT